MDPEEPDISTVEANECTWSCTQCCCTCAEVGSRHSMLKEEGPQWGSRITPTYKPGRCSHTAIWQGGSWTGSPHPGNPQSKWTSVRHVKWGYALNIIFYCTNKAKHIQSQLGRPSLGEENKNRSSLITLNPENPATQRVSIQQNDTRISSFNSDQHHKVLHLTLRISLYEKEEWGHLTL